MNRPLKFRAWDKEEKVLYQVEEIFFRDDGTICAVNRPDITWKDQKFELVDLMQYTGLKDRNGKEIYEGDILKHSDTFYPDVNQPEYFEVRYVMAPFGGYVACKEDGPKRLVARLFDDDGYQTEVIGNRWENPELVPKLTKGERDDIH